MATYRRTIITLDDNTAKKDYMLFAVFEKLWPGMEKPQCQLHCIHKGVDNAKRFDVGVHVDEIDEQNEIVDNPLPYVKLNNPVEMMWGKMYRDPDQGVEGFLLKKEHEDIDSVTDVLPITQSVQKVWCWFDMQRKMYSFLEANNISLAKIGKYTKSKLGIDICENELHIGCIYVVHYSIIKSVHVETIPMMPAVRCEIDWWEPAQEDVYIRVTERIIDKRSTPHQSIVAVKSGDKFALVQMDTRPKRIDIDITTAYDEKLFFLRNIAFLSTIADSNPKPEGKHTLATSAKQKAIGLEHYLRPAILNKEAIIQKQKMEFVFFDGDPNKKDENKAQAKACVERMISMAEKNVVIADPYFSKNQFDEYIAPLNNSELQISIVNCKEQMEEVASARTKASGVKVTWQEVISELGAAVTAYNAGGKSKAIVYCIQGQGRLHDRFVLTDNEGWIIGSSLSEFGGRGCSIVKLSESAHKTVNDLLQGWCDDRTVSDIIG